MKWSLCFFLILAPSVAYAEKTVSENDAPRNAASALLLPYYSDPSLSSEPRFESLLFSYATKTPQQTKKGLALRNAGIGLFISSLVGTGAGTALFLSSRLVSSLQQPLFISSLSTFGVSAALLVPGIIMWIVAEVKLL